jgi:hypothetical protein
VQKSRASVRAKYKAISDTSKARCTDASLQSCSHDQNASDDELQLVHIVTNDLSIMLHQLRLTGGCLQLIESNMYSQTELSGSVLVSEWG